MGFRISGEADSQYQLSPFLDRLGRLSPRSVYDCRLVANRLVAHVTPGGASSSQPDLSPSAAQINALSLLDDLLQRAFDRYCEQFPSALPSALALVSDRLGAEALDRTRKSFVEWLPPVAASGESATELESFLRSQRLLKELILLRLNNENPAARSLRPLFDDSELRNRCPVDELMAAVERFFAEPSSRENQQPDLLALLRSPIQASPGSLEGQLRYILDHWRDWVGAHLYELLSALDLIHEEEKAIFPPGPGPARVTSFRGQEEESEQFSTDDDWMPRAVLIAKNAYVWLDQLSRKYGRSISVLDEIPEAELEILANRGFTGLWLIGLWERSRASRTIKHWCGNPDAVASAYALFEYQIADDLGGEAACDKLRQTAWRHGIRLASDMVPNHMGIDSRWVIDHPGWFISLDHAPFPSYSFTGGDLSSDPRLGIYLEDHYYTRSDAAVVFKRVDHSTGEERFLYHGNDGTSMPWNDTAQLNYLLPEVREAVIQTILHVARQFPIIRFDAAMTLAKRHYQRLWFPEPGHGGAIPSRAEYALTREQFDAAMPVEFWREVVDRIAAEAPGTLLLAEAFWMMEGYFVRTLGMHRVYNSAFMNMLRDEENANYRSVIKNTIEFDPEILKRYVNFLNNPDESTAVAQFGKDDRYFGICLMMATLPGLPMFGHGQIEGFAEKYGMEYRRAYWEETEDPALVARHEREIFPLLHRRKLFAGVEQFRLYDLYTADGAVNEDVFAYSNGDGSDRALVIVHNRYAEAAGWIRTSAAFLDRSSRILRQESLGEALGLSGEPRHFCRFEDSLSGLQYLRSSAAMRDDGLFVSLGAYGRQLFLNFEEVADTPDGLYTRLNQRLEGRGVPSLDAELQKTLLEPILQPLETLLLGDPIRSLAESLRRHEFSLSPDDERPEDNTGRPPGPAPIATDVFLGELRDLLGAARNFLRSDAALDPIVEGAGQQILYLARAEMSLSIDPEPAALEKAPANEQDRHLSALRGATFHRPISSQLVLGDAGKSLTWLLWIVFRSLGSLLPDGNPAVRARSWIDEWRVEPMIRSALLAIDGDDGKVNRDLSALKLILAHAGWHDSPGADETVDAWLSDPDGRHFLSINEFEGVIWFNAESFEELLGWLWLAGELELLTSFPASTARQENAREEALRQLRKQVQLLRDAAASSHFRVDELRRRVGS